MEYPLISICVPIYGVQSYISRCAKSILEQSYSNIEYVFVDDSSPDLSMYILKSEILKYPQRIASCKIIRHNKNRGLAAARNSAVENATGEFLMWVDSDDYIDKDAVKLLVENQNLSGSDIVSFNSYAEYSNRIRLLKTPDFRDPADMAGKVISRSVPVCIWGRLIRTSLYKTNNVLVKEGCNVGEDYQVLPMLAYYASKVSTVNLFLYHYNCGNNGSYTASFNLSMYQDTWRSYEVLYSFFCDKGPFYLSNLNNGKICILLDFVIRCSEIDDEKFYKDNLYPHLKELKYSDLSTIPLYKKLICCVSFSWYLVRLYVLLSFMIKRNIFDRFVFIFK